MYAVHIRVEGEGRREVREKGKAGKVSAPVDVEVRAPKIKTES